MTQRDELAREFPPAEVRQFNKEWTGKDGRHHSMTFDYIEDETVMDRLDEVLGIGAWDVSVEPISVADGIVKVTLHAILEGKGVTFQDFGYATRADGEALKEAVSDGIRRCGRYLGIGRYLYRKHDSPSSTAGRGPSSPRPAAPRAVTVLQRAEYVNDRASEWPEPEEFAPLGGSAPAQVPTDVCPIHGTAWTGKPGDRWHGPKGVVPEGYCRHPGNVKRAARR